MPKSQRRLAVTLFVFVMLGILGAGLAMAAEPLQATPAQPILEPNPVPLWLAGVAEVCYDGFNGCAPEAPGPCCWKCPGGTGHWSCAPASSTNACKSLCLSHCGTTCGWI